MLDHAPHVGDNSRRIGQQAFVDVRNRRGPLPAELVEERGPIHTGLTFDQMDAVVRIRHAVPCAEGGEQSVERMDGPRSELGQRREVVEAVAIGQHVPVPLGQ